MISHNVTRKLDIHLAHCYSSGLNNTVIFKVQKLPICDQNNSSLKYSCIELLDSWLSEARFTGITFQVSYKL